MEQSGLSVPLAYHVSIIVAKAGAIHVCNTFRSTVVITVRGHKFNDCSTFQIGFAKYDDNLAVIHLAIEVSHNQRVVLPKHMIGDEEGAAELSVVVLALTASY